MQFLSNLLFAMATLCSKNSPSTSSSRNWSDLPGELVLEIANRLALIELHSFRGVCKDWRAATSKAPAIVSQPNSSPWLLTHETDNPICTFYSSHDQTHYTTNLPEMARATCIASNHGWLLLFQAGKIFFFSPFSRAKILLPVFPSLEITDHVATFTNPPTSEECTVVVIHRTDPSNVEINVLARGDETWKRVNHECHVATLGTVTGAKSDKGTFYFMDDKEKLLTYEIDKKEWTPYTIVERVSPGTRTMPFQCARRYFENSEIRKWLDLGGETSFSLCGGAIRDNYVVLNERIEASPEEESNCRQRCRHLKGIWVMQPTVPPIVPEQIW